MKSDMILRAEGNKKDFENLREDLEQDVEKIMRQIKQFRLKLKTKVKSKENPRGLLVQDELEYFKCFYMRHEQFSKLLEKDRTHWSENIHLSQKKSSALDQHLQDFIKRQ